MAAIEACQSRDQPSDRQGWTDSNRQHRATTHCRNAFGEPGNGIDSISQTGQERLPLRRQFKLVHMSQKTRQAQTRFKPTDAATYLSVGDVQISCLGTKRALPATDIKSTNSVQRVKITPHV